MVTAQTSFLVKHEIDIECNIIILVYSSIACTTLQSFPVQPVDTTENHGGLAKEVVAMVEQKGECIIVGGNNKIKGYILALIAVMIGVEKEDVCC